jgi:hypothetical protein
MLYPEVKFEIWIQKWKLEPAEYHCPKCQTKFKTTIPVVTKRSAGLRSPEHDCGPEYWTAVLKPRTQEAEDFLNTIV